MTWLPLNDAIVIIAHDEQKARERLERAITKAWQTPFGRMPQAIEDPNLPLRVQVIPPAGQAHPGPPMVGTAGAALGVIGDRMPLHALEPL